MTKKEKTLLNYLDLAIAMGKEDRMTTDCETQLFGGVFFTYGHFDYNFPKDRSWFNISFDIEDMVVKFDLDKDNALAIISEGFNDDNTTFDHFIGDQVVIKVNNLNTSITRISPMGFTGNELSLLQFFDKAIHHGKFHLSLVGFSDSDIYKVHRDNMEFFVDTKNPCVSLNFSIKHIAGEFCMDESRAVELLTTMYQNEEIDFTHCIGGGGTIEITNITTTTN